MAIEKNNLDFLRFSAYSIKDLITRKLSQSQQFTDQVFEGSNLAVLIDIFSHMAQCILYSLNNTAGESMFSDTRIYENMNRLVKFIGYNPKGVATPTVALTLDNKNKAYKDSEIYKYSAIDTGKTDTHGKKIYYSTVSNVKVNSNERFDVLFYNGLWKLYNHVFTSNGSEYQTFVLNDLISNADQNCYVVDGMVHVYVKETDGSMIQYKMVDQGLFTDNNIDNGSYIYKSSEAIFNLRLNEGKQYEITFGNGFTGRIPSKDSQIYVFYLEGNGADGQIQPYDISNKELQHSNAIFGIPSKLYNEVFSLAESDFVDGNLASAVYAKNGKWSNTQNSSLASKEESVDEIRRNAPEWFKTGNRLITTSDYEYYVKNRFRDNVVDVKCQNNWQYISTFYQWLYNLGINGKLTKADNSAYATRKPYGNYYVNQNKIEKFDFKYADAADGNNVYLWIKMRNDSDLYCNQIDEEILNIKALTQEAVYLKPLTLCFSPCAADESTAISYLTKNNGRFDPNNDSYIEITIDDNTMYSSNDVRLNIANIIKEFFNENNFTLGYTVDYSDLANLILNASSVSRLRTIYKNEDTGELRIINGLSFATWTPDVIDLGDDLDVSSTSRTLEVFQFPKLYNSNDIASKIKVIKKSISNVNSIQY